MCTEPFPHPIPGFSSTQGFFIRQWAGAHLSPLKVSPAAHKKEGHTPATLSLEFSSGNLILGKNRILPRSCLSCALWMGPNRIPPDFKLQKASSAFLPDSLVVFPGYLHGFALLLLLNPHPSTETTSGNPKLRKAGGGRAESECLHHPAFAFIKATELPIVRGARFLLISAAAHPGVGAVSHPGF